MFASLSNGVSSQLPIFMISKVYGATIVGYFVIAQRLVTLPAALISTSFSQVYFQKLTEAKNNNQLCLPILITAIKKLSIISVPIAFLVFLLGPYLVVLVFGNNWVISGNIIRYLSLTFLITFIVSPLSISLVVSNDNKLLAMWQYAYLFFGILCFVVFCYFLHVSYLVFFFWFVIYQYVSYIIYILLIVFRIRLLDKNSRGYIC